MLTLKEYYNLKPNAIYPKTEFVDELLSAFEAEFGEGCICRDSVIGWCNGKNKPSDSKFLPVISRVTGIPIEDVFK